MLEWTSGHTTDISIELIHREFLPTATNKQRGVQNLQFVLQQLQTAIVTLTN